MTHFISVKDAIAQGKGEVKIRGWCYRARGSNALRFIVLRDATEIIQCVVEKENVSEESWDDAQKIDIEASLELTGEIVEDKRAPTGYEVKVKEITMIGESVGWPIQKDQSTELLADLKHLWLRSRYMTSILKIRSTYVQAREEFFEKEGFFRFDSPILQPMQSEGGSTVFEVKFYDRKTYLAQTWQLYGEAAIFALEKVYDTAPTFRAEKSKTSRHLSEFWMLEMEAAWMDLHTVSEFAKKEIKYCLKKVLDKHQEELKILGRDIEKLKVAAEKEWPTIKYRDALKILKEKEGLDVPFGKDLRTVEEEKLMDHFDTPVVVTHYPVEIMAFYKPRDPKNPTTALGFDMLGPEENHELIGGSVRDTNLDELKKSLKAKGEKLEDYEYYFDIHSYGAVPHGGYGLGTERLIKWICGLETIKDAIGFPRTMTRWKP